MGLKQLHNKIMNDVDEVNIRNMLNEESFIRMRFEEQYLNQPYSMRDIEVMMEMAMVDIKEDNSCNETVIIDSLGGLDIQ